MKYLPFENITYKTKLDSAAIFERINENVEPERSFRIRGIFGSNNYKPYEGSVNGNSFSIRRIISYRNSFLPRIKGVIEKDLHGTRVNVKMRLHLFILVFIFIWCGGAGFGFFAFLTVSIGKGSFDLVILIPLGMLLFGYGLTIAGFKYESIKSKKYIAQLFEAEIEK